VWWREEGLATQTAANDSKASGGKVTGIQSWGFDTGALNVWARQQGQNRSVQTPAAPPRAST
jgi:multiple sugar transport system substrate-binding protein